MSSGRCSDESLRKVGAKPGQSRWGTEAARRYHHYWRDENAGWHHEQMSWISGSRPKLFLDKSDNAYLIYNADGNLTVARATAGSN